MKLIPRTLHDAVRVAVACSTLAAFTATAAVSEQEAAKLGKELTPVGAERAANKEGTIPAWTGGMTTPQAGWKPGQKRIDPYADDKPLIVRYRASPTVTTTLTIGSVGGAVWNRTDRPARDGDLQVDPAANKPAEKSPPAKEPPPLSPPPRPIKS